MHRERGYDRLLRVASPRTVFTPDSRAHSFDPTGNLSGTYGSCLSLRDPGHGHCSSEAKPIRNLRLSDWFERHVGIKLEARWSNPGPIGLTGRSKIPHHWLSRGCACGKREKSCDSRIRIPKGSRRATSLGPGLGFPRTR